MLYLLPCACLCQVYTQWRVVEAFVRLFLLRAGLHVHTTAAKKLGSTEDPQAERRERWLGCLLAALAAAVHAGAGVKAR